MVDILNKNLPYDVTCVFTVQEEIGTRGAKVAAYTVKPDYAIVLKPPQPATFRAMTVKSVYASLARAV